MTGGLYDLSSDLTGSAQLRLGVDGTGELSKLRNAFTFTQKEQISGVMSLGVLVQGPLDNPMIVAHGHAVTARYRAMPLNDIDATIVYRDGKVGIVPLLARYAGTDVTVRGTLDVSGEDSSFGYRRSRQRQRAASAVSRRTARRRAAALRCGRDRKRPALSRQRRVRVGARRRNASPGWSRWIRTAPGASCRSGCTPSAAISTAGT